MTSPQPGAPAQWGVILAGGRGSRIGGGKAGALLAGRPLLEHAAAIVRAAGLEPVACARAESVLPDAGIPVWREPAGEDPPHPLSGVAYALREAGAPIVAVAVDLPLLPPGVLAALAARPEPLVGVGEPAGRGLRPAALVLRADPSLAEAFAHAAATGAPVLRTLTALGAVLLEPAALDPRTGEHALLNVNDGDRLRRAELLLRGA